MTYDYKDGTETLSLDAVHQAFGSDLLSDAPPIKIPALAAGVFIAIVLGMRYDK